ncbi:MAG: TRAP transporter substrate-binding protein [Deltaproteobacteria bacterium]|nr:MAG: TRAP transporter substrate-binding protein [Deltaproteobacteria bacterium]
MRSKVKWVALLVIALFLVSGAVAQAKEKRILLKVPVAFSTVLPGLGDSILYVADRIETVSGGTLKMKVYEPGKLVPPFEILDAVSTGKVNAGYAAAGYWAGKIPASPFFTAVPFGPEAGEFMAWLYYGNGMKLYQEMYDRYGYNVKVFPLCILAPETAGWFKKPINSVEDLKGLRIRFFGLGGKVMQKLGASVSLLPGGEIFPALEKGALDATEFSMPAIDERLGFYKVAKYNYFPGWHQQATVLELLINKDVWNSMSKRQQMVIDVLCKASMADSFAHTEAIQGKVIRENEEKRGVKNMYWSDEMLKAFKKAWLEVVDEMVKKDEFFKKVWEDFQAFDKDYQYWEKYGFLPRR